MKKILVIVSRSHVDNPHKRIHYGWIEECSSMFDIAVWGPAYSDDLTSASLKKKIDQFKPDYIYITHRRSCDKWLPDLSGIKSIKKIYVEVDSYKYSRNDPWYSQFDSVYSRQPIWNFDRSVFPDFKYFRSIYKTIMRHKELPYKKKKIDKWADKSHRQFIKKRKYALTWEKTPLFRWSISNSDLYEGEAKRDGIYFLGRSSVKLYNERYHMTRRLKGKVFYVSEWDKDRYNSILRSASALICPTESNFGDFVPAKFFEFVASGSAVLTNCDLNLYDLGDLAENVIGYNGTDDLENKLSMDFTGYHNKTAEIMRNHTHFARYGELFR